MFNFFKRKSEQPPDERRLRAVQPTYVSKDTVVLSKVAPIIRNAYEIRLALYMAKSRGLRFVLAVRPGTKVDASVLALMQEHGGKVEDAQLQDYSVYIGRSKANGDEDGWVLGDAAAMATLNQAIQSGWLRERLQVGAVISASELSELESILRSEAIAVQNIDGENVQNALLALVAAAKKEGGNIFVQ